MIDRFAAPATAAERVEQLGLPPFDALLEFGKASESIFNIGVRDLDERHVLRIRLGEPSWGILQTPGDPRMLLDVFERDTLRGILFEQAIQQIAQLPRILRQAFEGGIRAEFGWACWLCIGFFIRPLRLRLPSRFPGANADAVGAHELGYRIVGARNDGKEGELRFCGERSGAE